MRVEETLKSNSDTFDAKSVRTVIDRVENSMLTLQQQELAGKNVSMRFHVRQHANSVATTLTVWAVDAAS